MANGFHGSRAEWDRVEQPLRALDATLASFATQHRMHLSSNEKNTPGRWLRWGEPVKRSISIYLENSEQLRYSVGLVAVEHRQTAMYWKREFPKRAVSIGEIEQRLPEWLEEARVLLESWTSEKLEYVRRL